MDNIFSAKRLGPVRAGDFRLRSGGRLKSMASRKPRTYTRVVFETPAAIADEAASLLVAHGALGCSVAKTIKNAPRRRTRKIVRLEAWFDELSSAGLRRIMKALEAGEMLARTDAPKPERIVDPGWATKWKGRFEPFEAGNFLIVPPWNRVENGKLTQLVIQPGQAFGTGHHGTTYGALNALGSIMAKRPVAAALDVGTGSGILAIATAKSGIAKVIAIDIDTVALENARENAALNGVDGRIRFSAMPLASVRGRFNLITANILSSVLIEMAAQMKRHLAADGRLILGGILAREASEVLAAYRPQLRRVSSRIDRGWSTLVLGR